MADAFSVRPFTCSHESLAEISGIMIFAGAERALLTGGTCMGMTILGKAIICEGPTARTVQFEAHPFPLSCELPALRLQLQDSPVCVCDFAPAGMGTFFIFTDCQMKRRCIYHTETSSVHSPMGLKHLQYCTGHRLTWGDALSARRGFAPVFALNHLCKKALQVPCQRPNSLRQ